MPGFFFYFYVILSRRYGITDVLPTAVCCDGPSFKEYVEPWEIGQLMGGN